ncbi:MAG: glycoside hydrolase family 1 protein [Parcubacteria group bacterium]
MKEEKKPASSAGKFPEGFLWGAAASSYQTEGDNSNSDWWEWEQKGKTKDKSGAACDYWNRWREDHELLSELGVNSFRLSLEWSRIEPEEGVFSVAAIDQYREMLEDLKKRNIKTQVTFWWWTNPIWFQKKYGWHKKASVKFFTEYVEKVAKELGDSIDMFQVLNEPMVPLGQGYLTGMFPPGKRNPLKLWRALRNIARAYIESYKIIHGIKPNAQVGMTHLYNWYESGKSNIFGKIIYGISKWFRVMSFNRRIRGYQDFFGLNYYRLGKINLLKIKSKKINFFIEEDENNIMGWIAYPEGIYKAIKEASQDYQIPIYITENGFPTNKGIEDGERVKFIQDHLYFIKKAIDEGADVRGYNSWSLMDNYEWLYGFEPRFGLIEIDYKTLERKPRKSFYAYKKIIENNGI